MKISDKDILMIDPNGNVINKFKNYSEATRELGLGGSSLIGRICKTEYGSCMGHYWLTGESYKKKVAKSTLYDWLNNNVKITKNINRDTMPIVQLDRHTYEFINRYNSLNEAAIMNGCDNKNGYDSIVKCCKFSRKSAKGFIWLLEEDYDSLTLEEIKKRHNEINNVNPNNKKINKYTMPVVKLDKRTYEFLDKYDCIVDAAVANNIDDKGGYDGIIRCCRFARKSTKGYAWVLEEDFDKMSTEELRMCFAGKGKSYETDRKTFDNTPIVQLKPKEYTFIKKFNSINEAAEKLNVNASGVSKCCKFQRRTSGGYAWMYLDDFNKYSIDEIKSMFGQIFWN